jgi:hypothetical protein
MSISLRRFRALVFEYHDGGAGGIAKHRYLVKDSGDDDQSWWCAVGTPSGREISNAAQPEHRIDGVFEFDASVAIVRDDALTVNGRSYKVKAVIPFAHDPHVIQVLGEGIDGRELTTS